MIRPTLVSLISFHAELGNAPYPAKLSLRTVFVPKCNLGTR